MGYVHCIYFKNEQLIFLLLAILVQIYLCHFKCVTVECSKIQHCKLLNFVFSILKLIVFWKPQKSLRVLCLFCTLFQSRELILGQFYLNLLNLLLCSRPLTCMSLLMYRWTYRLKVFFINQIFSLEDLLNIMYNWGTLLL